MNEWIGVKDRLPHFGMSVLVVYNGVTQFNTYALSEDETGWEDYVSGIEDYKIPFKEVTHWMPLPEPPK